MSISTFSGLVASIAATLDRTDLTSAIPTFVRLAEAQIDRRLRVRKQSTRATASIAAEFVTVPDNFAGVRTFDLSTDPPTPLQYLSPDELNQKRSSQFWANGKPVYYTVQGDEFQFLPSPDGTYTAELTYWLRLPPLSETNQINWLITNFPDAYLYGSLLQTAPYLKDDDRIGMWTGLFERILADINSDDAKTAGPMARRGRCF